MLFISFSSSFVYFLSPESFCLISSSSLIVFIIFLSFGHLSFHRLQFLSSLLQYSWLYLLSNYLNNFFTVNLPGNSPLLYTPSSCSCLAMSSISYQYSFLNSLIAFFVFFCILSFFPSIRFCYKPFPSY